MPKTDTIPCATCARPFPRAKLGFACKHFAHGRYLTYDAAKPGPSKVGDTACTACSILYDTAKPEADGSTSDAVIKEMDLHCLCVGCYRAHAQRNVLTQRRDRKRGYALVPREVHAHNQGMSMGVVAPVAKGTNVKVMFVPIPSTGRADFELMWVTVKRVTGDAFRGELANDPGLFDAKILKAEDPVAFEERHIVAVER